MELANKIVLEHDDLMIDFWSEDKRYNFCLAIQQIVIK